MEDKANLLESLLERAEEYSKTSFELLKLKALDKTSDVASSFVSRFVVIIVIFTFIFMLNIGVALWLGEILGKSWYGFFSLAAFYGIAGIILRFFMQKWIKKCVANFLIKIALK